MLHSYLGWTDLEHYLNNFIWVLTSKSATKKRLAQDDIAYCLFTDCLGIPRQDTKDVHGTVVIVFGLEVDTNEFIICVPVDKVVRACQATSSALSQSSLTLKDAQSLTGFLSFCTQAVRFLCAVYGILLPNTPLPQRNLHEDAFHLTSLKT